MTGPAPDLYRLAAGPAPLTEAELIACYTSVPRDRPWLRANFVTSIDGAVTVASYSAGLSSTADKHVFAILRMVCDALLVGAGTLRHEGYGPLRLDEQRRTWRRAHGLAEYPTLVIVSGRLDLHPAQPALSAAPTRPVIVTHHDAPADRRAALEPVAEVLAFGDRAVDLPAALAVLHRRGLRQILCEGGPQLFGALAAADLVDEVCLTVAPLLTGAGAGRIIAGPAMRQLTRLSLHHVLQAGDDLILRYARI